LIGFHVIKVNPLNYRRSWSVNLRPMLMFSVPLLPAAFAQYLLNYSDQWLLCVYSGTGAVGIYYIGIQVGSIVLMATSVVMYAFLPHSMRLIQEDIGHASAQLERLLRLLSMIFCVAAILLTAMGPHILQRFVPLAYHEASKVIGFIALGHVFFSYTYFSTLGSWRAGKSYDYSIAVVVGVVSNIALNLVYIPLFGIVAAAITTCFSMAIIVITSFILSAKRHEFNFSYGRLCATSALSFAWVGLYVFNKSNLHYNPSIEIVTTLAVLILIVLMNLRTSDLQSLRQSLLVTAKL
jgi:O-antigen/teichoic acid export membrane protein